jgi:uncharacterized membrane protein (DUF485 family)
LKEYIRILILCRRKSNIGVEREKLEIEEYGEKKLMTKRDKKAISAGGAIIVIFLVVIVLFAFFVDFVTCPVYRDIPLIKYACPLCGGDGKITLVQYIFHSLGLL